MQIIVYGILLVFSLYVIFIIWLRIQHPYWSKQPVYHNHKLIYKLYHPGIVNKIPSPKDRYVDLNSIMFSNFEDQHLFEKVSTFISTHYKSRDDIVYKPPPGDIESYYSSMNSKSFVSFMKHKTDKYDPSGKIITSDIMIGMITTRPISVILNKSSMSMELVDLLCVDPVYRKYNNVPKLIQTHKFHKENSRKCAQIYLFKNENQQHFNITPLCKCVNYAFDIFQWKTPIKLKQETILEVTDFTSDLMFELLVNSKFKNKLYIDIYTLKSCIKSGILNIYCLKVNHTILGVYVFKKSNSYYKNEQVFENICSINLTTNDLFIRGFHHAANMCCVKKRFRYLVIENTSNNDIIINEVRLSRRPLTEYTVSYYLYNYITKQINPNESLLLF